MRSNLDQTLNQAEQQITQRVDQLQPAAREAMQTARRELDQFITTLSDEAEQAIAPLERKLNQRLDAVTDQAGQTIRETMDRLNQARQRIESLGGLEQMPDRDAVQIVNALRDALNEADGASDRLNALCRRAATIHVQPDNSNASAPSSTDTDDQGTAEPQQSHFSQLPRLRLADQAQALADALDATEPPPAEAHDQPSPDTDSGYRQAG
jgi:exonuclease VII large subunit